MSFFSRRHGSFSERSSAFLFCVCVSACVRPDNNTAGRFFLGSHWLISVSGRWAFDRIVGSECPLSILSQRIDIFRLFFTALYDVIADVTTLFFTRLFFYFALSLSLFISLPFCFAVVVFFRVLLFAVRCFVVDFFWVVDDFTAWSTAAILCGVTLKLFFLGSCHLWSACFFCGRVRVFTYFSPFNQKIKNWRQKMDSQSTGKLGTLFTRSVFLFFVSY